MVIKGSILVGMLGRRGGYYLGRLSSTRCLWRGEGGPASFLRCWQCYQSDDKNGGVLIGGGGKRTSATKADISSRTAGKRLVEELEETEPHLIYSGPLTRQMRSLKIFSLTTSGLGLAMQPVLLEKAGEVHLAANVAVFGMVGFFTFVTPFLIHSLCKKYVTEISYDPGKDEYEAVTYNLFLRKRQIPFKAEDVKVPEVPGPFTTITVKIAGISKPVPLFIAPEAFIKPNHYGRFMGYDKPIDLKLNLEVDNNNAHNKNMLKDKK